MIAMYAMIYRDPPPKPFILSLFAERMEWIAFYHL